MAAIIRIFIALSLLSSTLLIASVYSEFVIEKNSLTVLSPDHLHALYDAAVGNLANQNQAAAGTITGSLVYPTKPSNSNGCKSFDGGQNTFTTSPASSTPTILLLDRGDCYFSLKVWNGQKAGAAAVLVADDIYEPLAASVKSSSSSGNKEKITIPSAIINRSLGENLKKALHKGEKVVIKLDWTGTGSAPNTQV